MDAVKKTYFYSSEEEKTKFNWFLYEYANLLHYEISKDQRIKFFKKELGNKRKLAEFCVHFSYKLKQSILDDIAEKTDRITIYPEYISSYYPKLSSRNVEILIISANKVLMQHLTVCTKCSMICITQRDQLTNMFDSIDMKGYYK